METLHRNNLRIIGTGPRTLIFVNGFGCDQSIWRYLLPTLATRFRLVLFDHMGAGLSDVQQYRPQKYASLEGYAQDLLDICQQLHLRDAILIGHSVGATIAMLAAIKAPEHFQQVVMVCPSPCYLNEPNYRGGFDRADIEQMLEFMQHDFSGWAESFAPFIMGNPDQPVLTAELIYSFCQNDPVIVKQFARVTFLSDNRPDVAHLHTPCLVVQCAKDLIAPLSIGEYLRKMLPAGQLVTLPLSGHCPHISAPEHTLRALEDCLSTLPGVG